MFAKGTKLYSIFQSRCPHCHEGDFFVDRNPYNLSKAGDILDHCPVCHRKYSPEPGFYYGAMYVSYALGVALFATVYVAVIMLAPEAPTWVAVVAVLGTLLVTTPYLYALSKIIWGNLFFSYKGVEPTKKELEKRSQRASAIGAADGH